MSGFDQWCRMLGWQTRALIEREGYDVGPLPVAAPSKPARRPTTLRLPPVRRSPR